MKKIIKKQNIIWIVFCYLILIGSSFLRPMILKRIMDQGILGKDMKLILQFAFSLIVLVVIEELTSIIQTRLFVDMQNRLVISLYTKAGQVLFRLKQSYFMENSSTEIVNKLSTDINSVCSLFDSNIMYVLGYALQIISGVIGLVVINWKLALLVLLVVPIKYLLIKMFAEKEEKLSEQEIEASANFSSWLGDSINGIREIKLWNLYREKQQNLISKQKEILEINKKGKLIQAYNMSTDSALKGLITAALYGIGGYFICKSKLTIGSLTAFITYSNYVINPISIVMNLKLIFAQIKPSIKRIEEFIKTDVEKKENIEGKICQLKHSINMENISFSYTERSIMQNVNLEIHKGEKIAIIGDNGGGKSTLLSMLLRFIEPEQGNIYIDGVDIKEYDIDQYRSMFSVVSQNIYLFADTLWNNIVMGKNIGLEEMNQKLEKMDMKGFLKKLPNGYESSLQKNGENLSGGERQKIGLLRALIKDSPILILDEATSSIDKDYDKFIHDMLLNDCSNKTIIVITHKQENLEGMDRIFQMKEHRLIEQM